MIRVSPPRHQGHQARPSTLFEPQRTQRAQSHPPTQKRRGAEPQRRRESCRRLHRTARFRPPNGGMHGVTSSGETPWPSADGHGATGPGNRFESELSCRSPGPVTCALEERRSRLFSSSFISWEGYAPPSRDAREERQNRRASGTSAGEKAGCDERSRSEQTVFSPATGDHQIAYRSAVKRRHRVSCSAFAPLRLCVFAGWVVGWALRSLRFLGWMGALRLCASVSLRFSWCSPLVSWCLGGLSFSQPSENPS